MTKETKMAGADARLALGELLCAFEAFKEANDRRLDEIEAKGAADIVLTEKVSRIDHALHQQKAALDRLALDARRPSLGAPSEAAPDERKAAFAGYLRKGDASGLLEAKDLVSGTPAEGGYLVPQTLEQDVSRRLSAVSPIRAIASVQEITGAAYRKPVSVGGTASSWVAETAARTETTPPTLSVVNIPTAEIYAMPAASPTLLEDGAVNVDEWLAREIEDVFATAEGKAFVSGSGTGEPTGFLSYTKTADASATWGEIGYVATGQAGDWPSSSPSDILLDLIYTTKSGYRANGRFVMNRSTISAVRKFKDTDGDYIWKPSQSVELEPTLLGYPVTEAEDMPAIGTDAYAIAFGDFARGYLIVDRLGMSVLRDPFSAKPYVLFYTRKRVGGAVQDFDAIKLLKFAAS